MITDAGREGRRHRLRPQKASAAAGGAHAILMRTRRSTRTLTEGREGETAGPCLAGSGLDAAEPRDGRQTVTWLGTFAPALIASTRSRLAVVRSLPL